MNSGSRVTIQQIAEGAVACRIGEQLKRDLFELSGRLARVRGFCERQHLRGRLRCWCPKCVTKRLVLRILDKQHK